MVDRFGMTDRNAEKDMRLLQDEKEEGLSLLFQMIIFPV